ncbi:MAG TPA: hypothetical protein VMY37_22695, partial [Thermoguttaceae bacterium]|nr:hypothetical protein [Thermoguttaceae bacterium]
GHGFAVSGDQPVESPGKERGATGLDEAARLLAEVESPGKERGATGKCDRQFLVSGGVTGEREGGNRGSRTRVYGIGVEITGKKGVTTGLALLSFAGVAGGVTGER